MWNEKSCTSHPQCRSGVRCVRRYVGDMMRHGGRRQSTVKGRRRRGRRGRAGRQWEVPGPVRRPVPGHGGGGGCRRRRSEEGRSRRRCDHRRPRHRVMAMGLHVHEAEVVGRGSRVVPVSGGVVAGKEQLRPGRRAVLERRCRVGCRRRRLHRLSQPGEVELVSVALAVYLFHSHSPATTLSHLRH